MYQQTTRQGVLSLEEFKRECIAPCGSVMVAIWRRAFATFIAIVLTVTPALCAERNGMVYFLSHKNDEVYSYDYRALDGDVSRIQAVDLTRDVGVRIRSGYSYYGRPFETEYIPSKIQLDGPKRTIPDIYSAFGLLVSDKFKSVVEKFEPNVHQFFPIELVWKDGSHAAYRYWFVPCNRLDTVDRENTTFEFRNLWFLDGSKDKALVFNRSQIGNHHVWIDKFIVMPTPAISETLKTELDAVGITGAHYQHFPETD